MRSTYTPKTETPPSTVVVGYHNWRFSALAVVAILIALATCYRLVTIPIKHGDELAALADSRRHYTRILEPDRGSLLDRNGKPLASSVPSVSFAIHPKGREDLASAAQRLAPVIDRDADQLYESMTSGSPFVWLARQTTDAKAAEIRALDIGSLPELNEPRRFLPAGDQFARSVIGNVFEGNGQSGAELIFDDLLAGKRGSYRVEQTASGLPLPGSGEDRVPLVQGASVLLTLDHILQHEVERILTKQVIETGSKGGVAVVSDPRTGEILASVSLSSDKDGEIYHDSLNKATSWIFEPGSIMKAVTFAGVLDAGIANADSTMDVPDTYILYDEEFTDSTGHPITTWSVRDIVTVSSNVGTIKWAQRLGSKRLNEYIRTFGFGQSANLGFAGETPGLMPGPNTWGGVATATTSLGQGISVTPLQMVGAFNAIANDGILVPPTILREVLHGDGRREIPQTENAQQVISPQTARQMRLILHNVVENGTGSQAQVKGYRVAGKTGTARKVQEGGGYRDELGNYSYVASFVGFLPAEAPELTILVTLDEPTGEIYAGQIAAPVFADIADAALRHMRIAPPAELDMSGGSRRSQSTPLLLTSTQSSHTIVTTKALEKPTTPTTEPVPAPENLDELRAAQNARQTESEGQTLTEPVELPANVNPQITPVPEPVPEPHTTGG